MTIESVADVSVSIEALDAGNFPILEKYAANTGNKLIFLIVDILI